MARFGRSYPIHNAVQVIHGSITAGGNNYTESVTDGATAGASVIQHNAAVVVNLNINLAITDATVANQVAAANGVSASSSAGASASATIQAANSASASASAAATATGGVAYQVLVSDSVTAGMAAAAALDTQASVTGTVTADAASAGGFPNTVSATGDCVAEAFVDSMLTHEEYPSMFRPISAGGPGEAFRPATSAPGKPFRNVSTGVRPELFKPRPH